MTETVYKNPGSAELHNEMCGQVCPKNIHAWEQFK